jgi:type IV secretory pathway VirJ component
MTMAERLEAARVKIDRALHAVESDEGASPVLVAVVNEFAKKANKATASPDERVAVIELEQAGDSAKAAAEADSGVSPAAREAVLEAHLAICAAKGKLDL